MLTRGQVAKRLNVSIAAVRAFEGWMLHPELRGRRWIFDVDEVNGLERLRESGGGRLSCPFSDVPNCRIGGSPQECEKEEHTQPAYDGGTLQPKPQSGESSRAIVGCEKDAPSASRQNEQLTAQIVEMLCELQEYFDSLSR
jgi:hypothetical protein